MSRPRLLIVSLASSLVILCWASARAFQKKAPAQRTYSWVTLKLHVADTTIRTVASMPPGTWLRATSPMNQPTEVAAISAVTTTSPPPVGADTK